MSVGKMCQVLEVSRNAFLNWKQDRKASRKAKNLQLVNCIKTIHQRSYRSYGSPRITLELIKKGHKVSRPFVARLMKIEGIRSQIQRSYVVTTDSKHSNPIAENILNRQFKVAETGKVWVSDITYIRVNSNWAYLTTMIDLADRKVVGWTISDDMGAENTVIAAWNKARINRSIQDGFILHSDRGVQYTCHAFRQILANNQKVTQSMSRKGNCWDNAVAESFFKTIKYELLNHYKFTSTKELKKVVFDYIETWYNRNRIHSALKNKSPLEWELHNIHNYKMAA
jgi:putative transposase